MPRFVRTGPRFGRARAYVAALVSCSVSCGPVYPPPRVRSVPAATATAGSPAPVPTSNPAPQGGAEGEETPSEIDDENSESDESSEADEDDGDEGEDNEAAAGEPAAAPSAAPATTATTAPLPSTAPAAATIPLANVQGVVRYRLRIHDNPVDPAAAFRCYGGCRQEPTEKSYLACLSRCPGFEADAGLTCSADEGIPNSVCIDRRPTAPRDEPSPGAIIAAVILNVALVFSLASLCNASPSQCGLRYPYSRY